MILNDNVYQYAPVIRTITLITLQEDAYQIVRMEHSLIVPQENVYKLVL